LFGADHKPAYRLCLKYCKSIVTNTATVTTFEVLLNKDREDISVFQVINSSSNNDLPIYNFLGLAESHTYVAFYIVQCAWRPKKHLSIDCVLRGVGPEAKEKVKNGAYRYNST